MLAGGWGRIVTISSSSAQSGSRTQAHYSAAKGGVVVLTKTLALELGQYGITVNTIPPRAVVTPMFLAAPFAQGAAGEENIKALAARSPVAALACPRISRPPPPSFAPMTPVTSPVRSSASTAATTPERASFRSAGPLDDQSVQTIDRPPVPC